MKISNKYIIKILACNVLLCLICIITSQGCSGNGQSGPAWTVMVYMDADNDLEPYSIFDIMEMSGGLINATYLNVNINQTLNIIVLFDRHNAYSTFDNDWTGTRLYRINPGNSGGINATRLSDDIYLNLSDRGDDDELNMGDPATLSGFISFCMDRFTAPNYALIIWNHGNGTRDSIGMYGLPDSREVCQDDDPGYAGTDYLYLDEIQQALGNNFSAENRLDIIGFDACFMGMAEVAYEFRESADFMVASMNTEQAFGWDYEYIFSSMTGTRDDESLSPKEFGKLIVESYERYIANGLPSESGETLSCVRLSCAQAIKTAVDSLGVAIAEETGKQSYIEALRDSSVHFYINDDLSRFYPFYDLYDLCINITSDVTLSQGLRNSADSVISELSAAIVMAFGDSGNGHGYYFGTGEEVNRGLSITFPRGDLEYDDGSGLKSHYAYQWWYTYEDTVLWSGNSDFLYGYIDFCNSDTDSNVEGWRELMEFWYDPDNNFTPGNY